MYLRLGAAVWVGALLLNAAPLTTASAVKHLSTEEAGARRPAALRGIVTQIIPEWRGFSLQDATEAVYVGSSTPLPAGLQAGQIVQVDGYTASGNFAPMIWAGNITVLHASRMPQAQRVSWKELSTGACDNRLVEVEAVVRSARQVGPPDWEWKTTALRLDLGGNLMWAYVRDGPALPPVPLVDATVRVRGICVVFANSQRQFQGIALSVASASDIDVVHPGPQDPFEAPLQPIRKLFWYGAGSVVFHRVKVQGTATLQVPSGVYLQQDAEGILVRAASAPGIRPGDRVEAVGFPSTGGYSVVLEDAVVRVTGQEPEPQPRDLAAESVLARVSNTPVVPNGALVRVAGRLLDRTRSAEDESLVLAEGGTTFSARLRGAKGELASVMPGSRIAVSGVCSVRVNDRGLPESFELLMRTPQDIQVLQRAPWLSRDLALRAAAALLAILAAALVGLALLRRRIAKQTETIREQFEREAALKARYGDLVENASDLVYVRDLSGRLLQVNYGAEELTGYSRGELLGMNVLDLVVPEERERAQQELAARAEVKGSRASSEWRFLTKTGRELVIETKERLLMEKNGQPICVECIGRDITARERAQAESIIERKRLEEQLHHSQKLESIGLLTGGVAHDFNNLLTVISGYAQMVLDRLPDGNPMREPIDEVVQAASRASALTRQLLLFSRRETASPRAINLNELITNLEKMLRRLIGEDIKLMLSLDARGGLIWADPGYVEQVVMNLAVNARDAMPDGGSLVVRTSDFHADERLACERPDVMEGVYVMLEVTDTGVGIPSELRSRIFEPFFTTKEEGKGTGLGLSTVYGIVKHSGGAISVDSEPGRGTRFEVLFPLTQASDGERAEPAPDSPPASGAETILVAEDESGVRRLICDVLTSHGYTVLEAANGREALQKAARYPGPIHLLLTDMVMPEMGGSMLTKRFAELRPRTPVLLMSGYTDRSLDPSETEGLLEKPFTPEGLLVRIRASLNTRRTAVPKPK
jgi:PAS domain S-box-containing protein